jgi:hypothetical protein
MKDYCEPYLNIQKLLKAYHSATLKGNFERATKLAHELADETIQLEIASIRALKDRWIGNVSS